MRAFIGMVFIVVSLSLGTEIYTEDAFVRGGGGSLDNEPLSFFTTVIFESVIWFLLLICLFLPQEKLEALNEWLKSLDPKYNDKD